MLLGSESFLSFSGLAPLHHLFSTLDSRPRVPTLSTLWKYPEGNVRNMVGSWADSESGVPQTLLISQVCLRFSLVNCASSGSFQDVDPCRLPRFFSQQVHSPSGPRPLFQTLVLPAHKRLNPNRPTVAAPFGRDHMHGSAISSLKLFDQVSLVMKTSR